MALIEDMLGSLTGYLGVQENIDDLKDLGNQALDKSIDLSGMAQSDIAFQPFSVTGPNGAGFSVDASGGGSFSTGAEGLTSDLLGTAGTFNQNLLQPLGDVYAAAQGQFGIGDQTGAGTSFANQLIQNNGLADSSNIMNTVLGLQGAGREQGLLSLFANSGQNAADQAQILGLLGGQYDPTRGTTAANLIQGQSIPGREQDIFAKLEALAQPERDRQNLQLEERLFAQGRGGVRDARFGGTPEQLALAKAQQEAINSNAVSAISQAREESALRGQQMAQGLGLGLQEQGQRDQSLLNALGIANNRFGLNYQNTQGAVDASIRERLGLGQLGIQSFGTGLQQQGVLGELGLGGFDAMLRQAVAQSGANQAASNTALANQQQQANILNQMVTTAYTPMNQTLGLLTGFTGLADIANANTRAGVNYGTALQQTGLQSYLESNVQAGNLAAGRNQAIAGIIQGILANSAANRAESGDGFWDGLFNTLGF